MRLEQIALVLSLAFAACGDNIHKNNPDGGGSDGSVPGDANLPVGPEVAVDQPVPGNTGLNALQPSLAFNGTQFLAVWSDNRASRNADIYATRIAADGSIVDATGIAINSASDKELTPVVAWVGDRWLVVWSASGDIQGATVDNGGVVTQLPAIAATAAAETVPAIAAQGTTALITWQSGTDVQAAQYSAGTVGSPFAVAATAADELEPAVAASAAGFLVVWTEAETRIRGRLVASGAVSGASFDVGPATGTQAEPAAAFNGTDYVVTYDNGSDVYGTRVSTAGAIQDVNGVAIGAATGTQSTSSVSCDPASCFVAWSDSRTIGTTGFDIYGQRTAFDLTAQGTNVAVATGARYEVNPVLAAGTTGWVGVWEDNRTGGATLIVGARIDSTGTVTDTTGFIVNTNNNAELNPAIATASATNELIVWADSRAVGNDIENVRFGGLFGPELDTSAKSVSNALGEQATPALTFDGANYLAVWTDSRNSTLDIFASRVDSTGVALDPNGIALSTAAGIQTGPRAASGGGVSLAVWQDRRNGDFDIYGAIVTPSGTVSVPDIVISNATDDQNSPTVAFDAANNVFIVVWSDNRSGNADIFAARVTPAGAVLDASGVQVTNDSAAQVRPAIAISGSTTMVVWDDRRVDAVGDIYGARLSASGSLTVLDPNATVINASPNQQTSPTITGLPNSNFAVAWTDQRDLTNGFDIYGARLNAMGQPDTATGFAISTQLGDENNASLLLGKDSTTAIVYHAFRNGTTRVFRRTLYFP